ncbi:MAG: DUF4038 domain-containing protein, partial [Gemmatimonadales bacterium]|nr:DUF4038 domain-containing protein [Gemmatimonadales bacterium]
MTQGAAVLLGVCAMGVLMGGLASGEAASVKGPLRVCQENPRYFTDSSSKAVYLTGSHTWRNLVDLGPSDPPATFDYEGYLDFMAERHHNFMRLWTREQSRSKKREEGPVAYAAPLPWARTGPGEALDGKPKFDLTRFNQEYFDRLRVRVKEAGERGIYVAIMLFQGHTVQMYEPWPWLGHPFNRANNINGIDGDPGDHEHGTLVHTLAIPAVTRLQEAYVRKVIDTVNDLDNVLYEIGNEIGPYSTQWQYHLISYIKGYEASKSRQHPVGMTFQ